MMKQAILILLLLCSFTAPAQTVFAPPGAVWHFEYTKDLDPPGLNYTRQDVVKDTLFEGKLCSKIIGKKISINPDGNGYDTLVLPAQYTYVVEDTVFYYNHNFSKFYPLYIFNVKVGDTVTYHVPYLRLPRTDTTFKVIVKNIDEIIIKGQRLKRIRHRDYYSSIFDMGVLIERLGADGQWIIGYQEYPRHPDAASIRCYQDDKIDTNIGLWKYGCEELAPLKLNGYLQNRSFNLYPNPAYDHLSLDYPVGYSAMEFTIIDITGRILPVPQQRSGNKVTFDLHNVPAGLYLLQLYDADGITNLKFQKTD